MSPSRPDAGPRTLALRDALLWDGTGTAPQRGDLLVVDDRIAGVADPCSVRADVVIDASGYSVCPGFIDIHGHSDMALLHPDAPDLLAPFLQQGITTQIVGNCGLGVAPAPVARRAQLAAFMALIRPRGVDWRWETFGEWVATLERSRPPLNVGALAAHGAIRCAVLGAAPGPASGAARTEMIGHVREALAAGALGLSAGLIYPPGMWADTDELVALCAPVAAADALFTCHVRGSSELALEAERELLEIGRRSGVRLQHSHHEAFGPPYWHLARQTLEMEEEARREGLDVASDVIPYHAVNTTLLAIYPPAALEGGVATLCERLADPESRARIADEIAGHRPTWPPWDGGWAHNLVRAGGWGNIVLLQAASEPHGDWLGQSLTAIAAREGTSPFACATEITIAAQGDVMARYHGITGAPDDDDVLRELLCHPAHAIGVDVILKGEGVSHPGGHGAMARLLGRYGRERGWVGMAEAIRKVTSLPATRLGLADRGRIAAGMAADLVVFDPDEIDETGTYERPESPPRGIRTVILNGRVAVNDGALVTRRAGRLLRRPRVAPL